MLWEWRSLEVLEVYSRVRPLSLRTVGLGHQCPVRRGKKKKTIGSSEEKDFLYI